MWPSKSVVNASWILLCGTLLGGCATAPIEPDGAPGPLTMSLPESPPTVTIHPTRVTVKNGAGQVLLDGAPDSNNAIASNKLGGRFDGTLEVATQYDNGTTKTQTLTHDPARQVSLSWDESRKQYVVKQTTPPRPSDRFAGQPGWAIQVFADYKFTPYDDTTISSSGSAVRGRPDLSDSMPSFGFGLRRYFDVLPSGIQPFAYAGFSEYFGNGGRKADVIYHFGATPDTGGEIEEQRSLLFGAGGQYLLANNVTAQLMLGLHATRLRMSVFSDERSGGGPENVFSQNRWMFRPTIGGGLMFPLMYMTGGSPLMGFFQYHAMMMGDVSGSVVSPFTSNTYSLRADGGIQHKLIFGVERRF